MKRNVKKLLSGVFVGCMLIATAASAATSSTTLSNRQTSSVGSNILQGSGTGTLTSNWTSGSDLKAYAMKVIEMWPDSSLANTKANSSNTSNSISVSLPSADNAYYVKLTGTKATTGSGSLTN